ncbi:thiopurine S-methyltransferase [Nitrospira sp.]|nr:thiopurine S-methyltransferase [Nitrospira sp.]
MDASFWQQRWERNEIAFHTAEANPLLLKHWPALALSPGRRVFVPLCGKSLDLGWLLARGYDVAGIELSEIAVSHLFADLGVEPQITDLRKLNRYTAKHIDIFQGDIFELSRGILGSVDAVYDRAALVALTESMRPRYTAHLTSITATAPQLLISYEYDQSKLNGPPFSVTGEEVHQHYDGAYQVTLLESVPVPGGLKGQCSATEHVWQLTQRTTSIF